MEMYIILLLGSFSIVLLFTPFLRRIANRNGFLDYPDERKIHKNAVPRVGGIAIALSFYALMILSCALFRDNLSELRENLTGLFAGATIIITVGIWDDLWGLGPQKKIAGQILAAIALMPFGFAINQLNIPFVGIIEIGWGLGALLSVFWIVGIINAVNFIDGIDGLAAGVAIIISSALFIISIITGQILMAVICLILAGSVMGFLPYNFHSATIFMGDCGAMFLGFMLAAVSIKVLFQASITASFLAPILIFGLPIVDTTWAIIRRITARQSPFRADGLHIHHRLINLGLTQRQTVIVLYAFSLLSATAGLVIFLAGGERTSVTIFTVMTIIALVGIVVLARLSTLQNSLQSNVKSTGTRLVSIGKRRPGQDQPHGETLVKEHIK